MNTLSWLIYAAEVLNNLQGVLIGCAVVSSLLIGIAALIKGLNTDCGDGLPGDWMKPIRYFWIVAGFALFAAAVPSSKTIYMIAASEAGETIVTSPDAVEMLGDLKAIIKKRLKEELGE